MTAIAWAIVFVSLIFYERFYQDEIKIKELSNAVGIFTIFCLVMLIGCTVKELMR